MNTENKSENVLSAAEEKLVRELVLDGREKGFVTLDEINENLGDETPSAEQLEKIFNIFAEMDIEVIDSEKKMDIITDQTDSGPELDFEANDLNLDPVNKVSSTDIPAVGSSRRTIFGKLARIIVISSHCNIL